MKCIRVLAVDDSETFLWGLESLLSLQPDIEMVGTARNGEQAVALVHLLNPEVVILDLRLAWNAAEPRSNQDVGLCVLGNIRAYTADISVIVMSSFSERRWVVRAMDAGAHGFLAKEAGVEEIVSAIRIVAHGGVVLTAEQLRWLREAPDPLTPREQEVLMLLARGKSDGEIAYALGISTRTASKHVENIREKVGAGSRGEAVALAFEAGLF